MLLQVGQLAETLLTVGAAVRFQAQVDPQVLGQVSRVGEGLGAVRTLVSLGLGVCFRVNLHVRLGEERQRTHFTPAGGDRGTRKRGSINFWSDVWSVSGAVRKYILPSIDQ